MAELAARLDAVFAGEPWSDPVDRALSSVVRHHRLPRAPFDALLDGFLWDAERVRYDTLSDVRAYAARVAASVGVLMTILMGRSDRSVLARACDLGVAMQLTNIARDVGEDARMGRLYLPESWLHEADVDSADFVRAPRPRQGVRVSVQRLLDEAERLYRRSESGLSELPRDCQGAIYAARLIYAEIGRRIEDADCDSTTRRAYVPLPRKLQLLARALSTRPPPSRSTLSEAPLPEVEFLLPRVP